MRKNTLLRRLTLFIALATAAVSVGCLGPPYVQGGLAIVVDVGPPAIHPEVRVLAPGPEFLWVPGYWDWSERNWLWVSGSWQRPPHAGARWAAPRYRHRAGRWSYYRGHWR